MYIQLWKPSNVFFCDILLTVFWWLPFKVANPDERTGHEGGRTAPHRPYILICQMQQEAMAKLLKIY